MVIDLSLNDVAGNGERSYEFILEKKFFVAFLKRWQEVIGQPSNSFHSSIEVFHSILSEPGFLGDNAFYLLKTIGLSKDFTLPLDHHLMISSGPVVKLGTHPNETLNRLGLHPYEEYALNLGYARSSLLMRILYSEKELDPEKRALVLLEDLARFMAYEKLDRKTIIWLTAYFLRDSSIPVREKAQSILSTIDRNEIVETLADLRWLILGGSALLSQAFRTELLTGVNFLQNLSLVQKVIGWTKYFKSKSILFTKTTADYSKIALMSVQRYISVLQPETKTATASALTTLTGHWYVYKSLNGDEPGFESTLQKELNQSLLTLGFSADLSKDLKALTSYGGGADSGVGADKVTTVTEDLKNYHVDRYLPKSPYSGLRQFDPLPLNLLNEVKKMNLADPSTVKDRAHSLLAKSQFKLDGQFDYKSYFLQQEYQEMLSGSRVRDLRLISMADFVLNKRISEIGSLLQDKGSTHFNQLSYDDLRANIQKALSLLNKNHTAYYSADSRSLLRETLGEGGNCVAIALLQISVLAPLWGSGDWELGIVFPPDHMLLAAFNRKLDLIIELDSMSEKSLSDYPYDILHPHLLVASGLGAVLASNYVVRKANGPTVLQSWQTEFEKKGLSFKPGNFLKKGIDRLKATIKNQTANITATILHTTSVRPTDSQQENPQFVLNLKSGGPKSPTPLISADWASKLESALEAAARKSSSAGSSDDWLKFSTQVGDFGQTHYSDVPDATILLRRDDIPNSKLITPILKGKLGYFNLKMLMRAPVYLAVHLYATDEQAKVLSQLPVEDFFKLLLLSLKEKGHELGSVFQKSFGEDLSAFLQESRNSTHAGMVSKNIKLEKLNHWLAEAFVFEENLDALTDYYNMGIASAVSERSEAHRVLHQFFEDIGYPKNTPFVAHHGNGETQIVLKQRAAISVDILKTTLMRGPESAENSPLLMGDFQSLFLIDKIFSVYAPDAYPVSTTPTRVVYDPWTGEHEFFSLNEERHWRPAIYNGKRWIESMTLMPKNAMRTKWLGVIDYFKEDPRQVRANLLLLLARIGNRVYSNHRMFIETAWKYLAEMTLQWELELPEIETTPCYTPSLTELRGIQLPRIESEKCRSLNPNGRRDSIPMICEKTSKENLSLRTGPRCDTPNQPTNFTVKYASKTHGRTRNARKDQIPLESFLALFSSPYNGGASPFTELHNRTMTLGVTPSNLHIATLGKEGLFSDALAQHLSKHRDYYKTFWSKEIEGFCNAVNIPANTQAFRLQLEAGQVCATAPTIQPVQTNTPSPKGRWF